MLGKIKNKLVFLSNLSHLDASDPRDTELFNKIALLYFLLFVGLIIQFTFSFISFYKQQYVITILDIFTTIVILILMWNLRTTLNHFFTALVYSIVLGGFFTYLIITGGINHQGYIWTFLFPVGVMFFFGHRIGLIISVCFLITTIALLGSVSVYHLYGIGFIVRYAIAYSTLMMISYIYEMTKNKLNKQIFEKNIMLEKAIQESEKADNLKSEFLAQMSHEIRTPINTILNYTSLLKSEFEDRLPEELEGSFESIDNASQRLIRTIDLILDLSAIESGTYDPIFERLPIGSTLILPLIDEFYHFAETKGLELQFEDNRTKDELIIVERYTITQTLSNLIHNAIKYTYNGYVKIILDKKRHLNNHYNRRYRHWNYFGIHAAVIPEVQSGKSGIYQEF